MLRVVNSKLLRQVSARSTVLKTAPIAFNQVNGQIKFYHNSAKVENELIVGGLTVGAVAITLKYALKGYEAYAQKNAANQPPAASDETVHSTDNAASSEAAEPVSKATTEEVLEEAKKETDAQHKKRAATAAAQPGFFGSLFNSSWFAKNFYDGGFEDKMTKREAALILGVRESATQERIKDAHRRIMQINHPDKGGSAYVTAKVNEAKDLLIKGK